MTERSEIGQDYIKRKNFKQLVSDFFQPVIMVAASKSADLLLQPNGLGAHELLQPFSRPRTPELQRKLRFQSVNRTINLNQDSTFQVRFVPWNKVSTIEPKLAESELEKLNLGENIHPMNLFEVDDRNSALELRSRILKEKLDPTPWFQIYRQEFLEGLRYSKADFLDHPIGYIIFLPSNNVHEAMDFLAKSTNPRNLSSNFRSRCYDASGLYLIIFLLYDSSNLDPNYEKEAKNTFSLLKQRLPRAFIRFVRINSLNENNLSKSGRPEGCGSLWGLMKVGEKATVPIAPVLVDQKDDLLRFSDPLRSLQEQDHISNLNITAETSHAPIYRGSLISAEEAQNLERGLWEAISDGILRDLQAQLNQAHIEISKTRSQFRNQIRSLFTRAPVVKVEGIESKNTQSNEEKYEFDSQEAQIRKVADFAFLMKDYLFALEYYKISATDYKIAKSMFHYALVLEMMGICQIMIDATNRKKAIEHFDQALSSYLSVGDIRRASRLAIWTRDALIDSEYSSFSANMLTSMSMKENNLMSGLFMEQAAYLHLLNETNSLPTPRFRKFGFSLVTAGKSYFLSGRVSLSLHCFGLAWNLYRASAWTSAKDDILSNLAVLDYHSQNYEKSAYNYAALISCGRYGPQEQQALIEQFLGVLQESPDLINKGMSLPLPIFDSQTIEVIFNDRYTLPLSVGQLLWQNASNENFNSSAGNDGVLPSLFAFSPAILSSNDTQSCVVDEPIVIQIEAKNSTCFDILLNQAQLICDLEIDGLEPEQAILFCDASILDYAIPAYCSKKIELSITVRRKGRLRLRSIQWYLFDGIRALYEFETIQELLDLSVRNESLQKSPVLFNYTAPCNNPSTKDLILQRRASRIFQPTQQRLITVLDQMPLLKVSFDHAHFPALMLLGQQAKSCIHICNEGSASVSNLSIRLTHPSFILLSIDESGDKFLEADENGIANLTVDIKPGETMPLYIFARAAYIGQHTAEFFFKYSSSDSTLHYRLCYLSHSFCVNPSISLEIHPKVHFLDIDTYHVLLDIHNNSEIGINIRRIFCQSIYWELYDAEYQFSGEHISRITLEPNESLHCVLKLHPLSRKPDANSGICQLSSVLGSLNSNEVDFYLKQITSVEKSIVRSSTLTSSELSLCVSWNLDDATDYHGDVYLLRKSVVDSIALSESPVAVSYNFNPVVYHDFDAARYVDISVKVSLRSLDPSMSFVCVLECLSPLEKYDPESKVFIRSSSSALIHKYLWWGKTKHIVSVCSKTATVPLFARFFNPGSFDLNRIRFIISYCEVQSERGEPVVPENLTRNVYFHNHQHFVHIRKKS